MWKVIKVPVDVEILKKNTTKISSARVCFCSRSTAGSWEIRGRQIAKMRSNWQAIDSGSPIDIQAFDLFCMVKKVDKPLLQRIQAAGKPVVFDIVDSWKQPLEGLIFRNKAMVRWLFKKKWAAINANGYIFPNRTMYDDLNTLVPNSTIIYHHYRPSIAINPIRPTVLKVGYEGAPFLGHWKKHIQKICAIRGVEFVINPERLADIDIVILVRGGRHASFMATNYKSNVKIANAFGSGTPVLAHENEASVRETGIDHIKFFNDQKGSFEQKLDELIADLTLRVSIHEAFKKAATKVSISEIADQTEVFFQKVLLQSVDK
jgi:hypothetical protein